MAVTLEQLQHQFNIISHFSRFTGLQVYQHSPVFFMTEFKLLRMDPILLRSTPSTPAAGAASRGTACGTGCCDATDGSVFAETGMETSVWVGCSICSSTGEQNMAMRAEFSRFNVSTLVVLDYTICCYMLVVRQHK